jgi:molybdopterin-binding protein
VGSCLADFRPRSSGAFKAWRCIVPPGAFHQWQPIARRHCAELDVIVVRLYRQATHQAEAAVMKLSARNQIKGKVVGVPKGPTTGHVRIDIGNGVIVTSSITNEAIDDLALKVGDDAIAVIKASDVMVAK